jgi:hypothetical protein
MTLDLAFQNFSSRAGPPCWRDLRRIANLDRSFFKWTALLTWKNEVTSVSLFNIAIARF